MTAVAQVFADETDDYRGLLAAIPRCVAEAIPDTCSVVLLEGDDVLMPVASYDADPAAIARLRKILPDPVQLADSPLVVEALARGHVLIPDLSAPEHANQAAMARLHALGARGVMIVPLATSGALYGALTVMRHRPTLAPLDDLDLEIVKNIARHAALAIGNARLFARLHDTEQQRAIEERAAATAVLLDAIVENIPDMVFVKDAAKLQFVRLNRAGEQLLGMSRDKLVGKNDYDFFPAAEAEFFIAKDRETLAQNSLVEIAEEPIETSHGRRWLHTKKVPLVDSTGRPSYLLGISRDITSYKLAVEELREAKAVAERASDELEAFSYSVAHDLRAPLRSIDGFAQALLEDYGDRIDDVGRRHLGRVRGAAQRMATLIDDLLALSRVTRADVVFERIDLSALAADAVAELRRAEPTRNVEVVIEPGLAVVADRRLLAVAVGNLLDNAWKFTGHTAGARVELGATVVDGERVLFVRDNGAGFDMRFVHKLFGVFQRLHPSVEFAGTGIGLVTVARIVKRHRGRVWAQAEVGHGATFYFTLRESHA